MRNSLLKLILIVQATLHLSLAAGFANNQPAKLSVTREGGEFQTIQAAIDAAPAGAVISIGPGTWAESLKITKPLTFEGAGADETIIRTPDDADQVTDPALEEFKTAVQKIESRQELEPLIRALMTDRLVPGSVLEVRDAKGVSLKGLKLAGVPTYGGDGNPLRGRRLVLIENADVTVEDCIVAGSTGSGIVIAGDSDVAITRSLVAGHWDRGITTYGRNAAKLTVTDSDIRNCYYAGITFGHGADATIEDCRISRTAWHGIRYDDASPTIKHNRIFNVARSGIYASGSTQATIERNLFLDNEMNGISCWFNNRDSIIGNTFAPNDREALSVIGGSAPKVQRNIFFAHPIAIIRSKTQDEAVIGSPALKENWFWKNEVKVQAAREGEVIEEPLPADSGSHSGEIGFVEAEKGDYALAPDSPAAKANVGVESPLGAESPFPLQEEEKAIMPEKPGSVDYRLWNKGAAE